MKKKSFITFSVLILLILLLAFPDSSFHGAKNGLLLWFNIILPTLLPFVIISNLIIQFHVTEYISLIFYPFLHKLLHISKEGCYPVIIGMLSGYPVGAKACADLVKVHKITLSEGQYILSFCNNASPVFITGYIALRCLNIANYQYTILGILIVSSLISGLLYQLMERIWRIFSNKNQKMKASLMIVNDFQKPLCEEKDSTFQILDNSIFNGFEILTKIGGYIVLLSFIAQIVYDLPILSIPLKSFLIGILEITTGCSALSTTTLSLNKKIVLTMAITAFGGLSSLAQTQSVIANSGLSIKKYIICKLINALIATLLTIILIVY